MIALNETVERRFLKRIRKTNEPNGCWLWTGARCSPAPYGQMRVADGRRHHAHRISYTIHKGPIPEGMLVRHACDNPPCVNPDHLDIGTFRDNSRDALERGRVPDRFHRALEYGEITVCKRGHSLTPSTMIVKRRPNGNAHRSCRMCLYEYMREYTKRPHVRKKIRKYAREYCRRQNDKTRVRPYAPRRRRKAA